MKKVISFVTASALCLGMCTSCGSLDKKIVGVWEATDISSSEIDKGYLEFKENGSGNIIMDTSSIIHVEDKNIIMGSGDQELTFPEQYIDYDGQTLKLTINDQDILTLESETNTGKDSYNGTYTLLSGVLYDAISSGLGQNNSSFNTDNVKVTFELEDKKSTATFNDIFSYKVNKKTLEIEGFASLIGSSSDGSPVKSEIKIDGDVLTIVDSDKNTELTRVK